MGKTLEDKANSISQENYSVANSNRRQGSVCPVINRLHSNHSRNIIVLSLISHELLRNFHAICPATTGNDEWSNHLKRSLWFWPYFGPQLCTGRQVWIGSLYSLLIEMDPAGSKGPPFLNIPVSHSPMISVIEHVVHGKISDEFRFRAYPTRAKFRILLYVKNEI